MQLQLFILYCRFLMASQNRTQGVFLFVVALSPFDFTFPLMLCAALGSLVALLVLNIFQKQVTPVRAAILYALEPVWAMLGALVLGLELTCMQNCLMWVKYYHYQQ